MINNLMKWLGILTDRLLEAIPDNKLGDLIVWLIEKIPLIIIGLILFGINKAFEHSFWMGLAVISIPINFMLFSRIKHSN